MIYNIPVYHDLRQNYYKLTFSFFDYSPVLGYFFKVTKGFHPLHVHFEGTDILIILCSILEKLKVTDKEPCCVLPFYVSEASCV